MGFWKTAWLTLLMYTLVLLLLSYNLPFSLLYRHIHSYDELFAEVERATNLRTQAADEYFTFEDPGQSLELYNNRWRRGNLTFAIGIVTVHRVKQDVKPKNLGYLRQSVSRIDRIMKQHSFFNDSLPFICNVDHIPSLHQDAISLQQFMPYTERYGNNSLGLSPLLIPGTQKYFKDIDKHASVYRKETLDYTYCLLFAGSLKPQYVILIEDDTLPHKDFPTVLEHMFTMRLKLIKNDFYKEEVSFIKLYFPAKWQGFAFEIRSILDLLSWTILGTTLLSILYFSLSEKLRYKNTINRKNLCIVFLVTLVSCWLVGRQNISELRRLSKHFYRLQPSEGCCTQAMLYPSHIVSSLGAYLTLSDSSTHTDLAIMDFTSEKNLIALQIEPNLFLHTGLHTSLIQPQKHPEEFILTV